MYILLFCLQEKPVIQKGAFLKTIRQRDVTTFWNWHWAVWEVSSMKCDSEHSLVCNTWFEVHWYCHGCLLFKRHNECIITVYTFHHLMWMDLVQDWSCFGKKKNSIKNIVLALESLRINCQSLRETLGKHWVQSKLTDWQKTSKK